MAKATDQQIPLLTYDSNVYVIRPNQPKWF